jgi:hypothetical protein
MKRKIEDELIIYDSTDDYDESFEGEDDIIEVSDNDNGNNSIAISVVSIIVIALFCCLISILVAKGYLR